MTLEKKSYDSLEVFASARLKQSLVEAPVTLRRLAREEAADKTLSTFPSLELKAVMRAAVGSVRVSHWLRDLDNRLKARK